jgi:hypothetical protein
LRAKRIKGKKDKRIIGQADKRAKKSLVEWEKIKNP